MYINTEPRCGRTMDPDIVLISNLGSGILMAPAGREGYLEDHGPHHTIFFRHNSKWWPIPLAFT